MLSINDDITDEQKAAILRKEFADIKVAPEDLFTEQELFGFLKLKVEGENYDWDVPKQIFERMAKDANERSNMKEFIEVFLEAEAILKEKIKQGSKKTEDYKQQKAEALMKLEEIRKEEVRNEYGIMDGSVLNVNVKGARNFLRESYEDQEIHPYVVLVCGDKRVQTEYVSSKNAVWDEEFSFPIETGLEDLHISVLDYNENLHDELIGKLMIPLSKISDQNKHEDWFKIYEKDGILSQTEIFLSLHWVHSRVKFLSELVKRWDEHILIEQEEIKLFYEDIATLYQPFGRLKRAIQGQYSEIESQANWKDVSHVSLSSSKRSKKAKIDFEPEKREKLASGSEIQLQPSLDARAQAVKNSPSSNEKPSRQQPNSNYSPDESKLHFKKAEVSVSESVWESKEIKNCKIGFFVFLFFTCFVCFQRAAFLEILIGGFFTILSLSTKIHSARVKILIFLIVISLSLDSLWLALFSKGFWRENHPELYLRRFSLSLSYLLLILKVVLVVLLSLLMKLLNNLEEEYKISDKINPIKLIEFSSTSK